MSYQGWYSKKDVLKDLRKATGKLVRGLDEGSVLVGDQPPPQRQYLLEGDAELQMLHLCGGPPPSSADCVVKPDLPGIKQMLKMVNGLTEEEEADKKKGQNESLFFDNVRTTELLSISKLNPNVKEFVPRACKVVAVAVGSPAKDCTSVTKTDATSITKTEASIITKEINNCKTDDTGDVTVNPIGEPGKEEMKNKLMAIIKNTSKATSMTVKRQRNLAIASLLKLHCEPQEAVIEKPKLISPAYFEKSNLAPNNTEQKVEVDKINGQSEKICPKAEIPKEKNVTIAETSTADIAASVHKVQKWLHNSEHAAKTPEKVIEKDIAGTKVFDSVKKSPETQKSLYLGAVTFKRKASKPISPTTTDSSACGVKTAKPTAYQPTGYASELVKTYQERMKQKEEEEVKKETGKHFLAAAITQLKAKDEEIRKRQAELTAQNDVTME